MAIRRDRQVQADALQSSALRQRTGSKIGLRPGLAPPDVKSVVRRLHRQVYGSEMEPTHARRQPIPA
jgi:hypothetical protein